MGVMIIHKFIVHVLDKNSDVPILNDFEGKINPEVDKFFQKVIKRVTKDDDLRKGVFKNYNDNVVRNCCEQIIYDENMQHLKRTVSCLGRSEPPVYEETLLRILLQR